MFLIFFLFVLVGLGTTKLFPAKAVSGATLQVAMPADVAMTVGPGNVPRVEFRADGGLLEVERNRAFSRAAAEAAIERVGVERLAEPYAVEMLNEENAWVSDAAARLLDDLEVETTLGSSVVQLRFLHPNAETAIKTLDAYVASYVGARNRSEAPPLRGAPNGGQTEDDPLSEVNRAILEFMDANDLSNLDTEIRAADAAMQAIAETQVEVRSKLSAARSRVDKLEGEIGATADEIELFVETMVIDRVTALTSERDQMAARFGDAHPLVEDLDQQITAARNEPTLNLESGRRRTGPNPVRQGLLQEVSRARAEVAALRASAAALERARSDGERNRRALAELEPEWRALIQKRDALERDAYATTGETEPAINGAFQEPVTILEPAQLIGDSAPRVHLLALFAALGVIAAIAAGCMRGWLARGLPTSGAVERTLGLRVLATVKDA